jgi:hypothetical protein
MSLRSRRRQGQIISVIVNYSRYVPLFTNTCKRAAERVAGGKPRPAPHGSADLIPFAYELHDSARSRRQKTWRVIRPQAQSAVGCLLSAFPRGVLKDPRLYAGSPVRQKIGPSRFAETWLSGDTRRAQTDGFAFSPTLNYEPLLRQKLWIGR